MLFFKLVLGVLYVHSFHKYIFFQVLSLMKVWETNVLQVKSDLQYIVYISHIIFEFVIKPANGFIFINFFFLTLIFWVLHVNIFPYY